MSEEVQFGQLYTLDKFMKRKIIVSLILVAVLLLSQYEVLLKGYARFFTIDNATSGMEATIVILSGNWKTRIP